MYSFKKYKNFLNENNYLTFDDLVFKYHPQLNTEFDKINFNNGYVLSVFRLDDKYLPGSEYSMFYFDHEKSKYILLFSSKEEVSEKMIELQKRKEKKRIFTTEDPYGEEDWNNENIVQKKKIKYKNFLNENNYLTFDDLVFKDHPYVDDVKIAKMDFDNGYSVSLLFGEKVYSNSKDTYEMMCFDYRGENIYDDVLPYLTKDQVSEKMIELQKRKEKKRIFTAEDPYGEEDWNDDDNISENLDQKEKITTVQLWNEYLRKGRKYVMDKLRYRDIEFVTKSKKVKKYKGKICGFVPAFLYSDKEIIILFDTKEYGVLKVNDKYPIILNPKSEYEDEDDE